MLEDVIVLFSAVISAGFVVMSVILLSRYRTLVSAANESSRLARDLWDALEARLKQQNERIVDLMARVELYGVQLTRQMAADHTMVATRQAAQGPPREPEPTKEESVEVPPAELREQVERAVRELAEPSIPAAGAVLADTEVDILRNLVAAPKTSAEIRLLIDRSREHTARLMKTLFDNQFVERDTTKKPFVYRLTDRGNNYLETASA